MKFKIGVVPARALSERDVDSAFTKCLDLHSRAQILQLDVNAGIFPPNEAQCIYKDLIHACCDSHRQVAYLAAAGL